MWLGNQTFCKRCHTTLAHPQANIPRSVSIIAICKGRCGKNAQLVPLYTAQRIPPNNAPRANAIYRGPFAAFGQTKATIPIIITTRTPIPTHRRINHSCIQGASHALQMFFAITPSRSESMAISAAKVARNLSPKTIICLIITKIKGFSLLFREKSVQYKSFVFFCFFMAYPQRFSSEDVLFFGPMQLDAVFFFYNYRLAEIT